jgi:alanine racemase
VNLAALRHNLRVVTRHAHQASGGHTRVWPVLKADGYGHGAPAVARTLERAGAEGFCVALLEEAVELRDAGIRAPILVMGGFNGASRGTCEEFAARDITPVVYDLAQLEGLARAARSRDETATVHVKIDTGMSRLGVRWSDLPSFIERVQRGPQVHVKGLMTHLACADADASFAGDDAETSTAQQVARFEQVAKLLQEAGIVPRTAVRHAGNSAALLRGEALFDAVRPGIALFGVSPFAGTVPEADTSELHAVMRVRSEIVDVRTLAVGQTVGYSALFQTRRPARIATVPMGYADGLPRRLTNCGHLLVRGRRAPIVGAVSMDMTMIDVTDVPDAAVGDEIVILGAQEGTHGKGEITANEVAEHAGTIAWEVLTSISRRVPRFYREP